jgi:hypothetical protein
MTTSLSNLPSAPALVVPNGAPSSVSGMSPPIPAPHGCGLHRRVTPVRFPARKSLEEFDFEHSRGLKRDLIAHLGTLDFVVAKDNVVFLGPPLEISAGQG